MSTLVQDLNVLNAQHGRLGPLPPDPSLVAGRLDPAEPSNPPASVNRDPHAAAEEILGQQKVDLAMLRLAFRYYAGTEEKKKEIAQDIDVTDITSATLNQVVSAVTRFHDDEREVYNIGKNLEPHSNPEQEEYDKLTRLSKQELIDLCYANSIIPPDTLEDKI